jgi:hypothetical protein
MPADPRSGKRVCGSARLVYRCAFGDWFAIAPERTIHPLPVDCASGMGFLNSLLSGTLDGARLLLVCLP